GFGFGFAFDPLHFSRGGLGRGYALGVFAGSRLGAMNRIESTWLDEPTTPLESLRSKIKAFGFVFTRCLRFQLESSRKKNQSAVLCALALLLIPSTFQGEG
ncbi:hypothetical protein, partial [Enterovibrio norvegicus]|uniref:hypothetical protein n=1 Tax=Enterovibrio norvegicus TaxID=188144 RepID=UPI001A7E0FA0